MQQLEQLAPRIIGTETEHNPVFVYSNGVEYGWPGGHLKFPDNVQHFASFAENGSRFYLDVHLLPEYATPECASIADAVHAEIAGEFYVVNALEDVTKRNGFVSRGTLHKRTATDAFYENYSQQVGQQFQSFRYKGSDKVCSWGYHENYGMTRDDFASKLTRNVVMAHLLSRVVLVGSGYWRPTQTDILRTLPSQKFVNITCESSTDTMHSKPIFNTRNESHAGLLDFARLHVVSGDANIGPWSTWMKLGSTSLVLRLAETGWAHLITDYLPAKPLEVLRQHNTIGSAALFELRNGHKARLIDVQDELAAACACLSQEVGLPKEELDILGAWQRAIDDYKKDPYSLVGRSDWISRKHWLENAYENLSGHESNGLLKKLGQADRFWDKLIPYAAPGSNPKSQRIGLALSVRSKMAFPGYDPDRVRQLVYSPPDGTRAAERARLIRAYAERGVEPSAIDWEVVGNNRLTNPAGGNLDGVA